MTFQLHAYLIWIFLTDPGVIIGERAEKRARFQTTLSTVAYRPLQASIPRAEFGLEAEHLLGEGSGLGYRKRVLGSLMVC